MIYGFEYDYAKIYVLKAVTTYNFHAIYKILLIDIENKDQIN